MCMISGFRVYIFPLICLCFFGCSLIPGELKTAEELMETSPDSALKVLRGIRRIQLINPADKALYALLMSQAYDKNDIKIESDSLISIAANYYDKKNHPCRICMAVFRQVRPQQGQRRGAGRCFAESAGIRRNDRQLQIAGTCVL